MYQIVSYSPLHIALDLLLPELDGVRSLHAGRHRADAERGDEPLAGRGNAGRHLALGRLFTFVARLLCGIVAILLDVLDGI